MAQSNFLKAHEFVAKWEGGLSDHPADRGGLTAYGASIEFVKGIARKQEGRNFLQQIGIGQPVTPERMRKITPEQVQAMFRHEFWDALKLDELPFRQAALLYDAAVNCGPVQAVKFSQRGYNACIGHDDKLEVDGVLGPLTRRALERDSDKVAKAIIKTRRDFYKGLVESRPDQGVFLKGWINRVDDLAKMLLVQEA